MNSLLQSALDNGIGIGPNYCVVILYRLRFSITASSRTMCLYCTVLVPTIILQSIYFKKAGVPFLYYVPLFSRPFSLPTSISPPSTIIEICIQYFFFLYSQRLKQFHGGLLLFSIPSFICECS